MSLAFKVSSTDFAIFASVPIFIFNKRKKGEKRMETRENFLKRTGIHTHINLASCVVLGVSQ